jgi:hypothetical protein
MKKIAVIQSNYIPWKGYFDIINMVDEFIVGDDVQYTKGDWRNRNLIKTKDGIKWLTIPVKTKDRTEQKISMVCVSGRGWARKHWRLIRQNYSGTEYFKKYRDIFEELYGECREEMSLSRINLRFIVTILGILGIRTKLSLSTDYPLREGRTERLIGLCEASHADVYISGPSAKAYIDQDDFERAGIKLIYMDYSGYPEYPQFYPPFTHFVSILDLLFHVGPDAPYYIWGWSTEDRTFLDIVNDENTL